MTPLLKALFDRTKLLSKKNPSKCYLIMSYNSKMAKRYGRYDISTIKLNNIHDKILARFKNGQILEIFKMSDI